MKLRVARKIRSQRKRLTDHVAATESARWSREDGQLKPWPRPLRCIPTHTTAQMDRAYARLSVMGRVDWHIDEAMFNGTLSHWRVDAWGYALQSFPSMPLLLTKMRSIE